jgi:hypothetical protein
LAVIGLAFVLAGCFGGADPTPSATPRPTASEPVASEPASVAAEPSTAPSEAPASATAAPSFGGGGGFTVMPNPEADALFLDRDECTNPQDGYQLQFPDDWWTNTEIARFPACVWFSPTFYEVVDETQRPDEIAIEIFWVGGDYGWFTEEFSREEVAVGTQRGVRAEIAGTPDDASAGTTYLYVVQLGPTPEEGPNLVARTDTEMGGDYDLNKAVLDRIMATIEFIGTTQ